MSGGNGLIYHILIMLRGKAAALRLRSFGLQSKRGCLCGGFGCSVQGLVLRPLSMLHTHVPCGARMIGLKGLADMPVIYSASYE